jgi:DNA repair protein SbcC/Rad50
MIENIKLTNFISHRDSSLPLEDGVNVFIGPNGAGKSSILDAVTYALYGEHTRDAAKNLLRRGAAGGSVSVKFGIGNREYLAERKFGKGGKLETATFRELAPNPRLIVAGERKQHEESMSEEVSKAFGLDYEKMKVAAIVQQGELDAIIRYKPKELKELINSLIGIDRLDTAYNSMYRALEGFRLRLRTECMNFDDQSIEALKAESQETLRKQEEATRQAQEASAGLAKLQLEQSKLEAELATMEPLRAKKGDLEDRRKGLLKYVVRKISELETEATRLEGVITTARKYLPILASKYSVEQSISRLEDENKRLGDRRTALVSDLRSVANAEERGRKLEGEIATSQTRIRSLLEKLQRRKKEISRLKSVKLPTRETEEQLTLKLKRADQELDARKDHVTEIGVVLDNYKTIREGGVCPTCGSTVEEINLDAKQGAKHTEHLEASAKYKAALQGRDSIKELFVLRKEYDEVQKTLRQQSEFYKDQEGDLKSERRKLGSMKNEAKAKTAEAKRKSVLETKRRATELKLKKLGERDKTLGRKRSQIIKAEAWLEQNEIRTKGDVEQIEKKLTSIRESVKSVPRDIARSPAKKLRVDDYSSELASKVVALEEEVSKFDEAAYLKMKGELEERVRPEVNQLISRSGGWKSQEAEAKERLSKLRDAQAKLETAIPYIRLYERIRSDVYNRDGVLATSLRSWALKELSRNASDYVRSFGIGLSELQLKEQKHDVDIECYSASGMADVKSMSGGEGVAIALALRFAMARLMGKGMVDFVALDEPTTHLDEERKRSLVRLVTEFNSVEKRTSLNQIIVITHDKEIFEDSEVNAVFQFEKDTGITTVTKS